VKLSFFLTLLFGSVAMAAELVVDSGLEKPEYYRQLVKRVRPQGRFTLYAVNGQHQTISYNFAWGDAKDSETNLVDIREAYDDTKFHRLFWDRIFTLEDSVLRVANEEIPISCVYVYGEDHRYGTKRGPLFPEFVLKVYIVANEFTCTGPKNPGFPHNSGRDEMWDTYLYYEIRDPTIMLPTEAKLRYRWNESHVVLEPQR
jgi:hypothetical protein